MYIYWVCDYYYSENDTVAPEAIFEKLVIIEFLPPPPQKKKARALAQYLSCTRFSDPDRSLNRKRKRFKVFEVEPRSNRGRTKVEPGSNYDDVIINLIIN